MYLNVKTFNNELRHTFLYSVPDLNVNIFTDYTQHNTPPAMTHTTTHVYILRVREREKKKKKNANIQ